MYHWVVLICLALTAYTFLSKIILRNNQIIRSPPGPKTWPVIGNLNLISALPHQSLHKLSQKYGSLMQLKFGSFQVVIASSPEIAKQILQTHDHKFASRPQTAAGKYTTYNYSNITWAPYGQYWRQGRKIYLSKLFRSTQLESFEYIRVEEMHKLVSSLIGLSGKPIMLKQHLCHFTLSVISRIVLGTKKYFWSESFDDQGSIIFEYDEFQEMLDELFLLNGVLNIGDWIPWLKFFDLQGYEKRMKALKKKFDKFHDYVFDDHKARRQGVKDFVPKDMVDLLLQLADDPNLEVKLDYDSLRGFTQVNRQIHFTFWPTFHLISIKIINLFTIIWF